MMKFTYHNCNVKEDADVVIVGIPDESGNFAARWGTSRGPKAIRKASKDRLTFIRKGKTHKILPERGLLVGKLHDYGNLKKKKITNFMENLSRKQFPVLLGGDHSNTALAVAGLQDRYKELGVVYLDAHPDIVSSTENYYGSVIHDIRESKVVNKKKVVEVGIRSIEKEEERNLHKNQIKFFTAMDVTDQGVAKIFSMIKRIMGKTPVYLSIDLDSIDPAFAPGVDTPVPFGLSSNDYLSLIKMCARNLNLVGFDIMELSPRYDIQQRTAQIAARSIIEILASR